MEAIKKEELHLGKKVKALRQQHQLTQEQVANALEVTPGYISNVENGRTTMSLRMLIYYARLTGVTLDYLVGNIDASYKDTALDHEILKLLSRLSADDKEKLIETINIWRK